MWVRQRRNDSNGVLFRGKHFYLLIADDILTTKDVASRPVDIVTVPRLKFWQHNFQHELLLKEMQMAVIFSHHVIEVGVAWVWLTGCIGYATKGEKVEENMCPQKYLNPQP